MSGKSLSEYGFADGGGEKGSMQTSSLKDIHNMIRNWIQKLLPGVCEFLLLF